VSREIVKDDNYCFACGQLNPQGLKMVVDRGQGQARSEVTLRREHQGWNGIAHGGLVSTLLDEIMAHAVISLFPQTVTVELKVRYKNPVPLHQALILDGRVTYHDARLIKAEAELRLKGDAQLLARAESKFMIYK